VFLFCWSPHRKLACISHLSCAWQIPRLQVFLGTISQRTPSLQPTHSCPNWQQYDISYLVLCFYTLCRIQYIHVYSINYIRSIHTITSPIQPSLLCIQRGYMFRLAQSHPQAFHWLLNSSVLQCSRKWNPTRLFTNICWWDTRLKVKAKYWLRWFKHIQWHSTP
jgi:hypothetical protein